MPSILASLQRIIAIKDLCFVLVVSSLVFGLYFAYDSVGALAPALKDAGLSTTDIGVLYSAYSAPAMFTVALGGMMIDKFGVNIVALVLLALTCVGTLIQALATPSGPITSTTTTMGWLVVGRIILGGSGEILYTAQGRMLKTHIPQRSLGISFAIIFSLGIIGTFFALNALPGLASVTNLKTASWVTFGTCLASFAMYAVYFPLDRHRKKARAARRAALAAMGSRASLASMGSRASFASSRAGSMVSMASMAPSTNTTLATDIAVTSTARPVPLPGETLPGAPAATVMLQSASSCSSIASSSSGSSGTPPPPLPVALVAAQPPAVSPTAMMGAPGTSRPVPPTVSTSPFLAAAQAATVGPAPPSTTPSGTPPATPMPAPPTLAVPDAAKAAPGPASVPTILAPVPLRPSLSDVPRRVLAVPGPMPGAPATPAQPAAPTPAGSTMRSSGSHESLVLIGAPPSPPPPTELVIGQPAAARPGNMMLPEGFVAMTDVPSAALRSIDDALAIPASAAATYQSAPVLPPPGTVLVVNASSAVPATTTTTAATAAHPPVMAPPASRLPHSTPHNSQLSLASAAATAAASAHASQHAPAPAAPAPTVPSAASHATLASASSNTGTASLIARVGSGLRSLVGTSRMYAMASAPLLGAIALDHSNPGARVQGAHPQLLVLPPTAEPAHFATALGADDGDDADMLTDDNMSAHEVHMVCSGSLSKLAGYASTRHLTSMPRAASIHALPTSGSTSVQLMPYQQQAGSVVIAEAAPKPPSTAPDAAPAAPRPKGWRGVVAGALDAITLPGRYWILSVAGMLWQGLLYACLAFFTDIICEKFSMPPEDAGRITSVVSVIALAVAPFGGGVLDRFGHALTVFIGLELMVIVCMLLLAITMLTPFIAVIALGILAGLEPALIWPIVSLVVPEKRFSTSQGFLYAGGNLLLVFSTWGVGRLRDAFGSYTPAVLVFTGMASLSCLLLILLWVDDMRRGWPLNRPQTAAKKEEDGSHSHHHHRHHHHHTAPSTTAEEKGEKIELLNMRKPEQDSRAQGEVSV